MHKGQTKGEKGLTHLVWTRLCERDHARLRGLLQKTKTETMSGLLRKIIQGRAVRVYVKDESLHVVMEELAALRAEIRSIGVNINQITRKFHTDPQLANRVRMATDALSGYARMETQTEQILVIISKLAKKWLSESQWEKQ